MKYALVVGAVVGLIISVGCSSLPTDVDDAIDSTRDSAEERASSEAIEQGPSSLELTAQEENILNNVDSVLEQCPLDGAPYEEGIDPHYMRQALYQCETGHPRVDGQVSGIDAEKQAHPDVRQARSDVDALGEKIEEWQQEISDIEAAQVEDRETYDAYQAFLDRPQEQAVRLMFRLREGEISGDSYRLTPEHMLGERVEAATSLDGMDEECREQFVNDRDFHRYSEDDHRYPANACDVIANWSELMGQYLNLHATTQAHETAAEVGRMIDVIEEDGYTTDGNRARLADLQAEQQRLESFYAEYFESTDVEMTEETLEAMATIPEQQSRYDDVLATSTQEMRWKPSTLHDEPEVRTALDPIFNGTAHTIQGYGVADPDWHIEHTAEGAPVSRFHNGAALTQHSDEGFCRIYNYQAVGEFDGTGYTQARIRMNLDREIYFLTACP